jgi:hypothetical protein
VLKAAFAESVVFSFNINTSSYEDYTESVALHVKHEEQKLCGTTEAARRLYRTA